MRLVVTVAVVTVVTLATGCGRANPRVKSTTFPAGNAEIVRAFSYDDQGRPVTVEEDDGFGAETTELEWDGALLVKITVADDDGDETISELTYDGDRLVTMTTEDIALAQETERTFTYEDGRLAAIESVRPFDGGQEDTSVTFAYEGGALVGLVNSSIVALDAGNAIENETATDLEVEDGKVRSVRTTNGDDVSRTEVRYADSGLVDGFDVPRAGFDAQGNEVEGTLTITYSYDDTGRIESALAESSIDGEDDEEVTIEYEDGDASGVDMTPFGVLPVGLWDLKGAFHSSFDVKTQAVRLGGLSF